MQNQRLSVLRSIFPATAFVLLLAGCSSDDAPSSKRASGTPTYKVGQPYEIDGKWYYPKEDFAYDASGTASWYGEDFHGGVTANGETYNKNELTAAHPTLPMPSLARVTNLENGRAVVVRINDRGPFKHNRLIDVSERAADILGFKNQGVARVRVQILANESRALASRAMQDSFGYQMANYQQPNVRMAALNQPQPLPPPVPADYGSRSYTQMASAEPLPAADKPTVLFARQPSPNDVQTEDLSSLPPVVSEGGAPHVRETAHEMAYEPVPSATYSHTTSSNIYVQAGAFSSRGNAMTLQGRLQNISRVEVMPLDQNGQTLYRVRLGPLKSAAQADRVFEQVRQAGVSAPKIVVD